MADVTVTVVNGHYLVEGIQLRPRFLIPKRLGDFILWLLFHRVDTRTEVVLSGLTDGGGK